MATRIYKKKLKQLHAEFFCLPPIEAKGFPGGVDYWGALSDFKEIQESHHKERYKECQKGLHKQLVILDEPRIVQ